MNGIDDGDDELLGDAIAEEDMGDEMGEDDDHDPDAEEGLDEDPFDASELGLKEINNLAHFGVSSHRPGNGVTELLNEDLEKYWQYAYLSPVGNPSC